jgi:hypothetical protein
MFIFWTGMYISGLKFLPINWMWGIGINFIPLFGGIFGLFTAQHWGGLKSAVGKGVTYLSWGLLSWSAGNWVWSYYNFFLSKDIPYPSLADIGYLLAVPLWMIGIFYLSKATGVKYGLRNTLGKLYLIILPIVVVIFSYYLLVLVARGGSISASEELLKIFFDFAYPIGDVIILTIALLTYGLSFRYLGGMYKWPVFIILFGFILMFLSDFFFSYETTLGTYYDGNVINLLFISALFMMGFGIASLDGKNR